MSRSQKWKDEWAFFLDGDGRRKYAELCRRCIHDCKQSFHAEVITVPGTSPNALRLSQDQQLTVRIKVENRPFYSLRVTRQLVPI